MNSKKIHNYYKSLNKYKNKLTKQQYNTLKGQIRAGDCLGALIGLNKIISRAG